MTLRYEFWRLKSRVTAHCTFRTFQTWHFDSVLSTYTYLHLNPRRTKPGLKDLFWCNRWRCNPIRPWEMVEGWEERREAADSVFLFPVVCWLSVMRPRLRPRRPVIGQGIRWLPREAWQSRQAEARKTDKSFQKQCRHKERKESCANLFAMCGLLTS